MNTPLTITRSSGFDRGKNLSFETTKITLGTDASCDVKFDPTWDKSVASNHAEIIWETDQWWLVDGGSQHGTLVGGQSVKRRKLAPGDAIEVGKGGPKIKVDWEPAAPAPVPAPAAATTSPPPVPVQTSAAAQAVSPAPSSAPPQSAAQPKSGLNVGAVVGIAVAAIVVLGAIGWGLFFRSGDSRNELAKIAAEKSGAVGLVVGIMPDRDPMGMATAWAVESHVFATNSHVVESVDAVMNAGGAAFIVINREGETRIRISGTRMHPRYGEPLVGFEGKEVAVPGYDVGLLLTESPAPAVLEIADRSELEGVDSGYTVAYLGFPMEGMAGGGAHVRSPVATMQAGIVTSATDYWLAEASYDKRLLIQHNLGAAGGASGSPVFNPNGEVVGILSAGNVAGLLENGNGELSRVPSGVLVNFAQRVDLLRDIWSNYPHAK